MLQTQVAVPSIYPALSYRDASAAIEWLEQAFGFETIMRVGGEGEGEVARAELRLGNGVVMLGTAKAEMGWLSPRDLPAVSGSTYVVVEDVDAQYARALAGGAEIIRPPNDTDYGSREFAARDLEGHHWSFGTYRPELRG